MSAPTIEPPATAAEAIESSVTVVEVIESPATATEAEVTRDGSEEWAICCSGGGIRSASYCLGAFQRIEEDNLLNPGSPISMSNVSMIVGVSGGSYITASRALVASSVAPNARQPAYAPGSPEEQHLRDNTNYLVPDAKTLLAGVLSLLFGVATTLLLFLTPLFAASHAWGWVLRSANVLKYSAGHPVTAAVTGTAWWIVPVIAAGITFLAFLWWWATLIPSPGGQEGHSQVAVTVLGWAAFLTLVLAVAMLGVPELIAWLSGPHSGALKTVLDDLGFGAGAAWTPAAVAGFVAAVIAVAQSARKSVAAFEMLKSGNSQQSSGLLATVTGYLRTLVLPWLASVLVLLAGFVAALRWVKDGAAAGFNRDQLWLFIAALAVMLATRLLADANRISLHDFYRWRLATAYAVQRDPVVQKDPSAPSRVKNVPGALLSELKGQQPKPVLCTTANINARRQVPVGRGGLSFTFDPDNATLRGPDPDEEVHASTRDYESLVGERRFTLFDVSAISGAAFSPLMGVTTRQAYRILFTAADLRLGVWIPHPAIVKAAREERDKQGDVSSVDGWRALGLLFWYVLPHPFWREGNTKLERREARLWAYVLKLRQEGTRFHQFVGGVLYHLLQPTLGMLYAEAAGHTSYRSTWMCVTDGGHYDNLGVVEALKRGARRILVLDASGDKPNTWFTIGGAIAQARSDARTEIELNPATMCHPPKDLGPGQVVTPSVTGTFTRYSLSAPPENGEILVCKLGWWETAPWDIRAYAANHPSYPADPTLEQLYDSAEFDAYRELGSASVGLTIQNGELAKLIAKK